MKTSYTTIRELPTAWFEFLADQRSLSDVFRWLENGRFRHGLLAINSADDERNPAELGIMEQAIKRVKHGRYVLIPASDKTRGHGTTGIAKFWKKDLAELLGHFDSTK